MIDTDLLKEFLSESQEHLCTVEDDILALERGGSEIDQSIVNRLFRSVHTVKGGAGFLNLDKVKNLAHALENLVGAIRSATLVPDQKVSEVLLDGTDRLRYLLDHIDENDASIDEQVAACAQLLGSGSSVPLPQQAGAASTEPTGPQPRFDLSRYDLAPVIANLQRLHVATIDLVTECSAKNRSPAALIAEMQSIGIVLDTNPKVDDNFKIVPDAGGHQWFSFVMGCIIDEAEMFNAGLDINPCWHRIYKTSEVPATAAATPPPVTPEPPPPTATPLPGSAQPEHLPQASRQPSHTASGSGSDQTVRITLGLLDNLMNLASELVLVRNQYLRSIALGDMQRLTAIGQRLNVVTSEIQSSIMQTRMRPVGTVFNKFSRVVRDLARQLGKKINLEIRGAEVELDKTIVEAMSDPMTHLVRNSIDHGIEMPEVRRRAGKPAEGAVCLSAFHQAGQVIIQIEDDGKGMDPKYILRKAVEKGMVTEEQSRTMSEREIFDLIFLPGFSTAEKVTEVSGRGVGMDVVRSGIQSLGGTVSIASAPGAGSTIRIELPLTLAIIPALIVAVESTCFAIPQVNIVEVVWLHGADVYQAIKNVDKKEVYRLRGTLLPLMRLSQILNIAKTFTDPVAGEIRSERRAQRSDRRRDGNSATDDRRVNPSERRTDLSNSLSIVVLRLSGERFGLIVDSVVDTEEIVVKSLHDQLKECSAYAGAAVLGNGRVAMILDIMALANLGSLQFGSAEGHSQMGKRSFDDHQTVLQFNIGGAERFAVPLCLITRVQEIQSGQIKRVHGREYLNYRDNLIPLVRIEQAVPAFSTDYAADNLSVIIPKSQKPFGVVVARIIDTMEVPAIIDTGTIHAPCIIGTQLLLGEPTLFIDLLRIMEIIDPAWNKDASANACARKNFLVVDDSAFYLNLLGSFLRASGATVETASNGNEALQILTNGKFDAVISDIEMPVLDGFGFIKAVRERNLAAGVPMLAVSTAEESYIKPRALDSGFDDFKPKGNLEQLLDAVNKLVRAGGKNPTAGQRDVEK